MTQPQPQWDDPQYIDDADVHYGPETLPQTALPFSIWVRRRYRWWPGSERNAPLVDRMIMVLLLAPGVGWATVSFGWIPAIFVAAEALVVCEIAYRFATGTMLGD